VTADAHDFAGREQEDPGSRPLHATVERIDSAGGHIDQALGKAGVQRLEIEEHGAGPLEPVDNLLRVLEAPWDHHRGRDRVPGLGACRGHRLHRARGGGRSPCKGGEEAHDDEGQSGQACDRQCEQGELDERDQRVAHVATAERLG
jgi:hypothetical protein